MSSPASSRSMSQRSNASRAQNRFPLRIESLDCGQPNTCHQPGKVFSDPSANCNVTPGGPPVRPFMTSATQRSVQKFTSAMSDVSAVSGANWKKGKYGLFQKAVGYAPSGYSRPRSISNRADPYSRFGWSSMMSASRTSAASSGCARIRDWMPFSLMQAARKSMSTLSKAPSGQGGKRSWNDPRWSGICFCASCRTLYLASVFRRSAFSFAFCN
ncbi:hypothetical protein D3C79_597120 [compost metagenome]